MIRYLYLIRSQLSVFANLSEKTDARFRLSWALSNRDNGLRRATERLCV